MEAVILTGSIFLALYLSAGVITDVHAQTELDGVEAVAVETNPDGTLVAVHLQITNHGDVPLQPIVQVWDRQNVTQLRWAVQEGPIEPGETRTVTALRPARSNVINKESAAATVRAPGRGQKVVVSLREVPNASDGE